MSFDWSQIPAHVGVVAVSKLQPTEKIRALAAARGHVDFGENYIQEALAKIEELSAMKLRWHLIGSLQSNKVKFLKSNFSLIHSVDSLKLAEKISQSALAESRRQPVLFQVNVGGEDSKSGFGRADFESAWSELRRLAGLEIRGLMTMPPLQNDAETNRPLFRELAELGRQIQRDAVEANQLSMGTSADFRVAIEEGATWVRLGSILFGERSRAAQ
ncbi:MAG: YggS family pyridoxal phosphate-dependent enzyme [Bdellovibrionaceae bacterium]|nr:YggS family pyridoxal phosphate-dependent enzyme [Pseudobdellovibrionaceae bacterium]